MQIPSGPLQVGQQLNFGLQLLQTKWPLWHCKIGGNTYSKQTGHSKRLAKSVELLDADTAAADVLATPLPRLPLLIFNCDIFYHKIK